MVLALSDGLELDPIRFLDGGAESGSVSPLTGTLREAPDADPQDLLALHRHLVVTRALDDAFVRLQRQGELGVYAPCRGQEAAQVGTTAALQPNDWIVPSYRELGCAVVRGIPLHAIVPSWRGTWFSDVDVHEHRFLPISIPVGTSALHATGLALGAALRARSAAGLAVDAPVPTADVVATYFGEGAASEGDVHEAMNAASVFSAPVVFVAQNNGWAISTPPRRQYATPTLAHRALAYGMPGWRVDGNDVLACWWAMQEAAARCRAGRGPVLLELLTFRMGPHTTSDDPSRYRTHDEEERWAQVDPIARFERFLRNHNVLDDSRAAEHTAAAEQQVNQLREATTKMADPNPLEVFEHLYASPPANLLAQRARMEQVLAAWGEGA